MGYSEQESELNKFHHFYLKTLRIFFTLIIYYKPMISWCCVQTIYYVQLLLYSDNHEFNHIIKIYIYISYSFILLFNSQVLISYLLNIYILSIEVKASEYCIILIIAYIKIFFSSFKVFSNRLVA
jgi:hypothetical protein